MTHAEQTQTVRGLLAEAGALMREAIAQIGNLPDTKANGLSYGDGCEIENRIRQLESKVMADNHAAFNER